MMTDLQLWHDETDFVIAETADEALRLWCDWTRLTPADREAEDVFEPWPTATIIWSEECGYDENKKRAVADLIAENGKGFLGSTEC
jgi:hypothetical protein